MKHPERIRLWVEARRARQQGDWNRAVELDEKLRREKLGQRNHADRLDALEARIDALKRKCTTGYSCGSTCITVKKECRTNPESSISRERGMRLHQLAKGEIKPRGIGNLKPEQAGQLGMEIMRFQRGGKKPDWYVEPKAAADEPGDSDELDVSTSEARLAFAKHMRQRGVARPGASFDANSLASATLRLCDEPGEVGRNARRMARFLSDSNLTVVVDAIRPDLQPNHRGPVSERHIEHLLRPDVIEKVSANNPMIKRLAESIDYLNEQADAHRNFKRAVKVGMEEDRKMGWDNPEAVQRGKDKIKYHDDNVKAYLKQVQETCGKLGVLLMLQPKVNGLADRNGILRLRDDPMDQRWKSTGPDLERLQKAVGRQVDSYGGVGTNSDYTLASRAGRTEHLMATFIHEVGHMVQFASGDARNTIPKMSDALRREVRVQDSLMIGGGSLVGPNKHFVSDYSTTNGLELFAESFVAFTLAPAQLRRRSPEVYAWIDDTLRRATANPKLPPTGMN